MSPGVRGDEKQTDRSVAPTVGETFVTRTRTSKWKKSGRWGGGRGRSKRTRVRRQSTEGIRTRSEITLTVERSSSTYF